MAIPFGIGPYAGVNFANIYVAPAVGAYNFGTSNPDFAVGTLAAGADGSTWVYCKYGVGGSTGIGYVVIMNEDFLAVMLSTANDDFGDHVGVAPAAALVDNFGWIQVYGTCDAIQVSASAAANAVLQTTATPGQLDDGGATLITTGIILTTARGAGAGTAPGTLNWPTQTATAGPA